MTINTPPSPFIEPADPGDHTQAAGEDAGADPATQALSAIGGGFDTAVDAGLSRALPPDAATTTRPMAVPAGLVSPVAQTGSIPVFRPTESVQPVTPHQVHDSGPGAGPVSSSVGGRAVGSRQRPTSAPVPLRISVLLLLAVFLLALGGVIVGHVRPAWLPHRSSASPAIDHPLLQAASKTSASQMTLLASSSSGQTYYVSARAYSIVVSVANPCWVQVTSVLRHTPVFAETIQPGLSPVAIPVSGDTTAMVAARTQSIAIIAAGHTLGTIASPRVGLTYRFTVTAPPKKT